MSIKRRQLFVGLLDNNKWTHEKLRAYFNKHGTTNDNQYVVDCEVMSYSEARFEGKSFAFLTFTDEACVDYCMSKRMQFNEEHGITIKRLLPDSITKCQRLMSSKDIVIRMGLPDPLFTDVNIRSYFGTYGKITDLKMLEEEEGTAGICLITFEDSDSTDRVLLDLPHYLNGKELLIDKYTTPEYICCLSQYRLIDETNVHQVKRWYPLFRNLTDFMRPINTLYKTQLALVKYNLTQQIFTQREKLTENKEKLLEFENTSNDVKQNFIQLCRMNEDLKKQIEDIRKKNDANQIEFENQIEEQRRKNQELQDAMICLRGNSS